MVLPQIKMVIVETKFLFSLLIKVNENHAFMQKIYVLPCCWSCLHTQGTTTCGGQNTHIWATSAWDSMYSSTILEYTHFFSSLEWTCNIIFGIVQHVFCNQILYSQLLFHTESYNNFLPGATNTYVNRPKYHLWVWITEKPDTSTCRIA